MALPMVLLAAGWSLQALADQLLLKVVVWAALLSVTMYLAWRVMLTLDDRRAFNAYAGKMAALMPARLSSRTKEDAGDFAENPAGRSDRRG
jgi:hypothetical protein